MSTRRYKDTRKYRTRKMRGGKKNYGKNWTTAIQAAQKTLSKTGSLQAARKSLRTQALTNARKLFGSVTSI